MMMNGWSESVLDLYRFAWVFALVTWPLIGLASLSWYKHALGSEVAAVWTRQWRVLLAAITFGGGMFLIGGALDQKVPGGMSLVRAINNSGIGNAAADHPMDVAIIVVQLWSAGLVPVLAGVLAVKVYEKWLNGRVSEAERQVGAAGVKAWVGGWNLLLGLGLAVCAWAGLGGLSLLADVLLVAMVLLAYPMTQLLLRGGAMSSSAHGMRDVYGLAGEDLSAERERVLKMLEEGKVNAEEAAELLSALGETLPATRETIERWSAGQKLALVGAAVVLVGFLMPWFEFSPAREMREAMGQMMNAMPMMGNLTPAPNANPVPADGPVVKQSGGDIGHGLGWIVLAIAVGVAVLPVFKLDVSKENLRAGKLVAMGAGVVILLYLLSEGFSHVSYGIVVAMIGYGIEGMGVVREQWRFAGEPAARVEVAV